MTERRKSPRIIVDLVSVEVYVHPNGVTELELREICLVKNISETGMLFESDMEAEPGAVLRLTFALPDSPIVIRTDAIVIHTARQRKREIGVQYKNLAIAEQKLLQYFITKALSKSQPPER